jgi:uncharacterized protein (UPF0147 family)
MAVCVEARLRRLRWRIRSHAFLAGLCLVTATALGGGTLLGLMDWWLELSSGVRAVLALAWGLGCLWVGWRFWVLPLWTRLSEVALALWVEKQRPGLRDQLASAVSFVLEQRRGLAAGDSPELRAAVIQQVEQAIETVSWGGLLNRRSLRWALMAATAALGPFLALLVWDPLSVSIAARRLLLPFGEARWPHQTVLEFVDLKTRVARGDPFEVVVRAVSGRIPDGAEATYTYEDGTSSVQPLKPRGKRDFVGGLEVALTPFRVSVQAGNTQIGPVPIDVVPPPDVKDLAVTLEYPAYTRRPPEKLPEGAGQVRAVWGSQAKLWVRFTKPVTEAEIRFDDGSRVPLNLDADHRSGSAQFRVQRDGSYWLKLIDRDGIENRQVVRYELRALPDRAPEVVLEEPSGDLFVTPQGKVLVKVLLKDDFGVQRATLHYKVGEEETGSEHQEDWGMFPETPTRIELRRHWDLAPLKLQIGQVVTWYLSAKDADDLRGPNVGKSRAGRLFVVGDRELLDRLADRQRLLVEELARVLRQEQQIATGIADLREEAAQETPVRERHVSQLRAAEVAQQQVRRQLTGPHGVQQLAAQTLNELTNNQLSSEALAQRLGQVVSVLEALDAGPLAEAERHLLEARKGIERAAAQQQSFDPQTREDLAAVSDRQQKVIETLGQLLQDLGRWENLREVARDAESLLQQQAELAERSRELGAKTLGQLADELPAELRAGLGKVSHRQEQLGGALERLQQRMRDVAARVSAQEPGVGQLLQQAAEALETAGTSGLMRQAAQDLRQNRVGEAQRAQGQALRDLQSLLDLLQQESPGLQRLVRELRRMEQELEELRKRQLQHLERVQKLAQEGDQNKSARELAELARQQRELEQELRRLQMQMSRYNARRAAHRGASAAGRMRRAAEQLGQNQTAEAAQEEQGVLEDLQAAQDELAQARREAEALLAMEQLRQIEGQLQSLYERQVAATKEGQRLVQELQGRQDRWTRALLSSALRLAQEQGHVAADAAALIKALDQAPTFALVLKHAVALMERARDRLQDRQVNDETLRVQKQAEAQLSLLLEALKQDQQGDRQEEQGDGNQQGGGGGSGAGRAAGIPLIAQLKLLKMLQMDINQGTAELDRAKLQEGGEWTPEQKDHLRRLQQLQGELANTVRSLTEATAEMPEDHEADAGDNEHSGEGDKP